MSPEFVLYTNNYSDNRKVQTYLGYEIVGYKGLIGLFFHLFIYTKRVSGIF